MNWLEIIGWVGSILVVVSLTQARVLRFRWLNLIGSTIATIYNAIVGIWPFAAMNGAIALINIFWLFKLYRQRHSTATYQTVRVDWDDAYLAHLLGSHADDMASFWLGFSQNQIDETCLVFLVVCADETVGVVCLRPNGLGQATVLLDWVSARYRDFTPGEFVYRQSGVFAEDGITSLHVDAKHHDDAYLTRMGFCRNDNGWQLTLPTAVE